MAITRDFHIYGRMELQFHLVQLTKNQLLRGLVPSNVLPSLDCQDDERESSTIFCCGGKELDWQDINNLEEKRRQLLAYDSDNSGYRIIFTSFTGTVFRYILCDTLFWLTIIVFIGKRMSCSHGENGGCYFHIQVDETSITVMGAFLSFILTFFVNQARSDYNDAYMIAMNTKGE